MLKNLFCALLLVAGLAAAGAASAQDRDTRCGAPATGLKADGSGEPVTLTAAQAIGQRVNAQGVWEVCAATPNRGCGEGGTGYMPGQGAVDMTPGEAVGWKTDGNGAWRRCEACLPAEPQAFRAWSVGGAMCTTARQYDSDPNSRGRDRVIGHGESFAWSQWTGQMRGLLIERCDDGVRRRIAATCAPALGCDTAVRAWRGPLLEDGSQAEYVYDARGDKLVPNGRTVLAMAANGDTWPATCEAGDWVVPNVLPAKTKAPEPPRVKATGCGSQTFGARVGLKALSYWRYAGDRVRPGDVVQVRPVGGGAAVDAACGADGRLVLR